MNQTTNNHINNLKSNLKDFYKKFYVTKMIKGSIVSIAIILPLFLFVDLLIFYAALPDFVRFLLFYGFILLLLSTLFFGIIDPILRLLRINKGISDEEAANFIGNHYHEIGDKLLNTLQFADTNSSNSLMLASIESRSKFLSPYDFSRAVPPIERKKSILFLLIPLSLLIGILTFNKRVVTDGTNRLMNYQTDFSKIAPFKFEVLPGNTSVVAGNNLALQVLLTGDEIPSTVFVEVNGIRYRTHFESGKFSYSLPNIHNATTYKFEAGGFLSELYTIEVVPNPQISQVNLAIKPPKHTQLKGNTISNPAVIEVPEGSRMLWDVRIKNAEELAISQNDSVISQFSLNKGKVSFEETASNSTISVFQLKQPDNSFKDAYQCQLIVVKDQYPAVNVKAQTDSLNPNTTFFIGNIQDDYGFRSLRAVFTEKDSTWSKAIKINSTEINQVFSLVLDHELLNSSTEVYFIVTDNDQPNGYKTSKSIPFNINVLNGLQKDSSLLAQSDELLKEFKDLTKESKELDQQIKNNKKDLLEKKNLNWEDQQKLNELVKAQKKQEENIKKANEKYKAYKNEANKRESTSDEILQKQQQLEQLYEKLMDEETKKLYEELQKLMEELNKDEIQKHLEKMEMNQEDMLEELDRNLEIFKQLELEQGMEKSLEKLDELAKKQQELAEQNKNKEITNEENIEKQKELNEEFDQLQKEMERLDSLNKELDKPNELDFQKEEQEDIQKDQKNSLQNSQDKKQKESSENQEDAAEKMEKMKEKMGESMNLNQQTQEGEDLEAMRRLLENVLELSFQQEALMDELKGLERNDPYINTVANNQKRLEETSQVVKDSLYALAARVPQLDELVDKEIKAMTRNMEQSIVELKERKTPETLMHQQKSLTAINNLALLLDEIIQQMEQQQSSSKSGTGSCSKPGGGSPKPSMKSSAQKQKELAKKIEQMKKELEKKGNKPGQKSPGQMGGQMSKEVAQMAAQQEMIRKEIRKMSEELQKEGNLQGAGELKKLEELMEQNETDLINFDLDNEFLSRQEQINTKMLEAQNAQREREMEETRKSKTAQQYKNPSNQTLDKYEQQKQTELELLRLYNPDLSGYYKGQVNRYNQELNQK